MVRSLKKRHWVKGVVVSFIYKINYFKKRCFASCSKTKERKGGGGGVQGGGGGGI